MLPTFWRSTCFHRQASYCTSCTGWYRTKWNQSDTYGNWIYGSFLCYRHTHFAHDHFLTIGTYPFSHSTFVHWITNANAYLDNGNVHNTHQFDVFRDFWDQHSKNFDDRSYRLAKHSGRQRSWKQDLVEEQNFFRSCTVDNYFGNYAVVRTNVLTDHGVTHSHSKVVQSNYEVYIFKEGENVCNWHRIPV